jgi:hypothetical protein
MPYLFLKDAHSILRWVVILTCLYALLRVWNGLLNKRPWEKADRLSGLAFTSALNLQFFLGLGLYAISPLTVPAMKNFGAAMKDSTLRFFLVEHPTAMLLAVIIAQAGFSLSKRAPSDRARFLRATIAYTLAALLILAAIPWPFLKYGRPLFPDLGGG